MITAYCISGLGADWQIFKKIRLPDYVKIIHIPWLEPARQESLDGYTKRMSDKIDSKMPFILIGMSFGGMVAIELNKILKPVCTIIISTAKSRKEFPLQFTLIRVLRLNKIVPASVLKIPNPLINWFFGAFSREEKSMLAYFLENVSRNYLKWAMNKVLNWKNEWVPENVFHIHGSADRILPIRNIKADYIIKKGSHFMTFDRAGEINIILENIIRRFYTAGV